MTHLLFTIFAQKYVSPSTYHSLPYLKNKILGLCSKGGSYCRGRAIWTAKGSSARLPAIPFPLGCRDEAMRHSPHLSYYLAPFTYPPPSSPFSLFFHTATHTAPYLFDDHLRPFLSRRVLFLLFLSFSFIEACLRYVVSALPIWRPMFSSYLKRKS